MNTRITRNRIGAVLAAGLVVGGAVATVAIADSPTPRPPIDASVEAPADLRSVAAWATANGYTGLSPSGLGRVPSPAVESVDRTDLTSVAAWATANGYTGLSPSGLGRVPSPVPVAASADLTVVAQWAAANGYTGLSPASLRPTGG